MNPWRWSHKKSKHVGLINKILWYWTSGNDIVHFVGLSIAIWVSTMHDLNNIKLIFCTPRNFARSGKSVFVRSIIKDTVPEEQLTFSGITQLPLEGVSWQFTSGYPRTVATKYCKVCCIWSVIKDTLLEQQCTFSAVTRLALEAVSWKFITGNSHDIPYKHFEFCCDRPMITGTLLQELYTFSSVSRL
jgi:hypothetical protein